MILVTTLSLRGQTTVSVDDNGVLTTPLNFISANAATAATIRAGTEADKFITPLNLATLIEARNTGGAVGGKIYLNAGAGATLVDQAADAGEVDLSGGAGDAARGGSILLYGGAGSQALGGSLLLRGGSATSARGGNFYSSGGTAAEARGGDLLLYGATLPGGDIITYDGGGGIDTRVGTVQLGLTASRTTITKSASAAGNTLTLPTESGVLATRGWLGVRNVVADGATPTVALGTVDTVAMTAGAVVTLNVNGRQRSYALRAENVSDVPNGVTLVRPADYNAATNKVILEDITSDGGSVDVRVFGATGNGVTDDRAAIQAAIYYGAEVGKEVYLPPGTYYVSADPTNQVGLLLPSGSTFRGAGWSTVIRFPAAGQTVCLANVRSFGDQTTQDTGDTDIHVSDLKLDLQGTGNNGLAFGGVVGGSITNVWVEAASGYAIHLVRNNDTPSAAGRSTEAVLISSCRVTNVRDVGIELSGANNCSVVNCYVDGVGATGVLGTGYECWNGSKNNVFSGNVARGIGSSNLFTAFRIDPADSSGSPAVPDTANNLFVGNVAQNVYVGFKCNSAVGGRKIRKNTFSNNQLQASAGDSSGIVLANAEDMVIKDNILSGFNRPFDLNRPLLHEDQFSCPGIIIESNTWFDSGAPLELYGVVAGSFSNNKVIRSADGSGVKLFGARFSLVRGNVAWNLGSTSATPFIVFGSVGGVESENNLVSDNSIIDSRTGTARKSFYAVALGDASGGNVVRDNLAVNSPQGVSIITNETDNVLVGNLPAALAYTNGQMIYSSTQAASSVAGGAETTLRQVSLPSQALRKDGDALEIIAALTFAANANNKRVRAYFGSVVVYDSDPKPENGTTLVLRLRIVRSSATSQTIIVFVDGSAKLLQPGRLDFGNVDMLTAIGFRITAQGVAFQDTVLRSLSLQYWASP